jgi:UDP-N-acetylmuramoyl-tripeptide--D-alanyl-D-alanine ligase
MIVTVVELLVLAGAFAAQMARWLRVLQREHYEPSAMLMFLGRWTAPPIAPAKATHSLRNRRPLTLSAWLFIAFVVALIIDTQSHGHLKVLLVVVTALYGYFAPQGLTMKGRTSPLVWTRRLRTTAIVAATIAVIIVAVVATRSAVMFPALLIVWAVPPLLDVTTRLLRPFEKRNARKFIAKASARLARVHPRVIAITGSYGKTSTKNHLADILRPDGTTVATPKSFNNQAGLSRAINEGLIDGTTNFIAEMGTYGVGEIAALCEWCPPSISIITAIGPVHLERMKSIETIERAKFEITEKATTVIVNVDDDRLAQWPKRLMGKKVVTASSLSSNAHVRVRVDGPTWGIEVGGQKIGQVPAPVGVQPSNVACAIAAALELGVPLEEISRRCVFTPVANRLQSAQAGSGVWVIDDTFNANPASAMAALRVLESLEVEGRRVVVTPGMIELGDRQWAENARFADVVRERGFELVVVGRTNAAALLEGDHDARRFDFRDEAVSWVRANLVAGDAVLYLNDLPDHYP